MTQYRIAEHRRTDALSTFYVEYKGLLPWWFRYQNWDYGRYGDAQFTTLEKAREYVRSLQTTDETIIHPIS